MALPARLQVSNLAATLQVEAASADPMAVSTIQARKEQLCEDEAHIGTDKQNMRLKRLSLDSQATPHNEDNDDQDNVKSKLYELGINSQVTLHDLGKESQAQLCCEFPKPPVTRPNIPSDTGNDCDAR
ncbi:hypothetical protein HDU98_006455 [Podochytrium sp. JEL0797]|nr:hypothetical protein HDU98_006455 [Podochytrium sp. JEL0797]